MVALRLATLIACDINYEQKLRGGSDAPHDRELV